MVAYDITRDGVTNGLWLFALWALFAAAMCAFSVNWVKRRVFPGRAPFLLAVSVLFMAVTVYVLVVGFSRREACLGNARAGNFEVTEGVVSKLERHGRSAPFSYSFMLGEKRFTIERALVSSCGFAERPNFQLKLADGRRLIIEHRDHEIYRVRLPKDI